MSWSNYDSVLSQIRAAGLIVDTVTVGRLVRTRVEGSREKKGWYSLREHRRPSGDVVLVGSYGVWEGVNNNAKKIEVNGDPLTKEEREALKARAAEDRRRAAALQKVVADRAATRAARAWAKLSHSGHCDYLDRKGVNAHGVRFSDKGNLVIPVCDPKGEIRGLQIIYGKAAAKKKGRDKDFWPTGMQKHGHYHLLGIPHGLVLVAEGYATAATIYEATGLPVAVAFDAGNLQPVAQALRKAYRGVRILICADDDAIQKCAQCKEFTDVSAETCAHCGRSHFKKNAGVDSAAAAALAVDGAWMRPLFQAVRTDKSLTDFNDLARAEGLHVVRAQIESRLGELGWSVPMRAGGGATQGGGGLKSLITIDEACERYVIIYGGAGTIYDRQLHLLVPKSDVIDILPEHGWREWKNRGDQRQIALLKHVGFDPTESDPGVTCNLWCGWPTQPRKGSCDKLLELLEYLCSGEDKGGEVYKWVLKWLAYPLQHPGAKMKTALVFHGPQGVGKNLFFETYMSIYGEYGRVIDQAAIEDKFNDWASRKLFLIADEVVARQELYHTKNKLKSLITGDWIRINSKHVAAHDERNHVNLVFLSNETQPLVIESDDRRYTVVWTPQKLPPELYVEVSNEIADGGAAALHHYLLELDLGDFRPWTLPPMTAAKKELIEVSMDSVERFTDQWINGDLDPVPIVPARGEDLYDLYKTWCGRQGYLRFATLPKFQTELTRRAPLERKVARYQSGQRNVQARFVWPKWVEQPPDQSQPAWLTECIEKFRDGVSTWKEQ